MVYKWPALTVPRRREEFAESTANAVWLRKIYV